MSESDIQAEILLDLGRGDSRLFRNHVAKGWTGELVKIEGPFTILRNARHGTFGLCVGSSDTIGIKRTLITPQMVGRLLGVFTAIEVKDAGGRRRDEQIKFVRMVQNFGGYAGFAISVDEARAIVDPLV